VTFPAFKAGDSALRGSNGGFDFHTPPPTIRCFMCKLQRSKTSRHLGVTVQVERIALCSAAWRSGIHLL